MQVAAINDFDPVWGTALQQSIASNKIDIAHTLLSAGAHVNAPAGRNEWISARSALQAATERGIAPLVTLLLQHGADCNATAGEFWVLTALQAAAEEGHLRIAAMLLEAGADINAPGASMTDATALEWASVRGRLDIVCLLLERDTDVEGLEERCKRAAKLAEREGNFVISKLLKEYKRS